MSKSKGLELQRKELSQLFKCTSLIGSSCWNKIRKWHDCEALSFVCGQSKYHECPRKVKQSDDSPATNVFDSVDICSVLRPFGQFEDVSL